MNKKYKVLDVIPWQICPKCNGSGYVPCASGGSAWYISVSCDVCGGKKIIPMHVVKKPKED